MTVQQRRTREKELLRQQILDAARELLDCHGCDSFSMRQLAEKVEYSPTTIYLYFRDKSDLLFHLCEQSFSRLVRQLGAIASLAADPLEALRASMIAYVEFGLKNPADYVAAFVLPHSTNAPDSDPLLRANSMAMRPIGFLRQSLEECIRAGKLPKLDLDLTSQAVWASLHGITSLLIVHHGFPWKDRERVIDHVIDATIEGLKAR